MNTLRVMTFNVRFGTADDGANRWELRRDLCFQVIRKAGCHLVCLQEVLPFQLDEVLDALPGFAYVGEARYGNAFAPILFAREHLEAGRTGDFWVSETPDVPRSRGWDAAVPRICTWGTFRLPGGPRFAVFNTHLDHSGTVARLKGAELIAARMQALSDPPRLLAGDLNCGEDTEPLEALRAAGLRDSFRDVFGEGPVSTFHGFRALERLGKIDYILCDDGWEVRGAEIVREAVEGRYPSDHYPVVAELVPS